MLPASFASPAVVRIIGGAIARFAGYRFPRSSPFTVHSRRAHGQLDDQRRQQRRLIVAALVGA
jgi:hypothetical protein